jgi:tetratricopeptide (TPR) repeat protein
MLHKRKEFHSEIDELISKASHFIAESRMKDAYECLDRALALDFDHPDVLAGLKYINFWQGRIQSAINQVELIDQAEALLHHWKDFTRFISGFPSSEALVESFRKLIFTRVHDLFSGIGSGEADPDIQLWLGIASKGIGNYEQALEHLQQAVQAGSPRGRLLSELADIYALIGEEQKARVMFREAFFQDPQDIDIEAFEAELFVRLCDQVRDTGLDSPEILEWIPVYGTLWGVLSIKRELRALEYGKLRQKIFSLEQEIRDDNRRPLLMPRLINHYFWLIDHLVMNREDQRKIDEILLKIRSLSPEVYKRYTN